MLYLCDIHKERKRKRKDEVINWLREREREREREKEKIIYVVCDISKNKHTYTNETQIDLCGGTKYKLCKLNKQIFQYSFFHSHSLFSS